ncbi:hypothetical protein [Xanthomonas phage DES1]|nr:hypothetical protein [Xanthomonas phage DES1]
MGNSIMSIYGKESRTKLVATTPEFKFVLPEQLMGVEIEAERTGDSTLPSQSAVGRLWEVKSDGSLMDGREYVLTSPMEGDQLSQAITMFFRVARLEQVATSSTHIHLDMSEEETTLNVLQVVFALVYMLEPVLWHVGDPSRKWCGFTHPINTAPRDIIEYLFAEDFNVKAPEFASVTRSISRYFGLNVNALSKYGSLEFRYFPTATSAEQLVGWINLVQSFKKAGQQLDTMRALANAMETEQSYHGLIETSFYDWKDIILANVPYRVASSAFYELTEHHYGAVNRRVDYGRVMQSNTAFAKIGKKRKAAVKRDVAAPGSSLPDLASLPRLGGFSNILRRMQEREIRLGAIAGSTVVVNYALQSVEVPANVSAECNAIVIYNGMLYVGATRPSGSTFWVGAESLRIHRELVNNTAVTNALRYLGQFGLPESYVNRVRPILRDALAISNS